MVTKNDNNVDAIFAYLEGLFGENPKCELLYSSDVELLVAIMLSAQCTDKRVNLVTRELFKVFKTIRDFAAADLAALEKLIYSTGFYRNKARNIIAMANQVLTLHDGTIPTDFSALCSLAGVGRKTASVFLCEYHNLPAIAVDTHVGRLAARLGLSSAKNARGIERDLAKLLPKEKWAKCHLLVLFGRYYCTARAPKCANCELAKDGICGHFNGILKCKSEKGE